MSPNDGFSMKELAQMINAVMGRKVLTEEQLSNIMDGAKVAFDRGGMNAVLEYLMKVTQADVDKEVLQKFAKNVQSDPSLGLDILQGKQRPPRKK
ncbi:hypothetical protein [Laceyella putida]|uniref:Uncharacterized protein n=1 Tax=Laceyella putida TaxID=110101 RepID=A0ABW2RJP3_9BACL